MTSPSRSEPTLTLVVNPSSGRGRAGRLLPRVQAEIARRRPDVGLQVQATTSWQHARDLCLAAVAASRPDGDGRASDQLLVMGGDGMAHLGLNACAGTGVPLGVLPAGTGNDFCRGVGLPLAMDAAIDTVCATSTRTIDLSELTGDHLDAGPRVFAGSVVSSGYDARVNDHANHMPTRMGSLAYAWAALAELATFTPLHYRLEIDGVRRDVEAMFVAVGNAGVFGGGMHVCPDARVDDGWLDLTIVHPVRRSTLLRLLPQMYSGRFARNPAVERVRARRIGLDGDGLIVMADGERLGDVPVTITCRPAALTLLG